MIKMSENGLKKFESAWDEVRDCFFRIKLRKARIVTVREKGGKVYHYTEPIRKAGS